MESKEGSSRALSRATTTAMATAEASAAGSNALESPPLFMRTASKDEATMRTSKPQEGGNSPPTLVHHSQGVPRVKADDDMAIRMKSMVDRINALTDEDLRWGQDKG